MKEGIRSAIVTGAFVLLGGLVAAGASVAATAWSEEGENERIERRLDEEVRGASRVLLSRFTTTLSYTAAALEADSYLSFGPEFVAPISAGDLKLITGRLSVDEYREVDLALRGTTSFFVLSRQAAGMPLTRSGRANLAALRANIHRARGALAGAADLK